MENAFAVVIGSGVLLSRAIRFAHRVPIRFGGSLSFLYLCGDHFVPTSFVETAQQPLTSRWSHQSSASEIGLHSQMPATPTTESRNVPTSTIALGIVCPMANESETAVRFVNEVLAQCQAMDFKSIKFFAVLDRASRDDTLDLLLEFAKTERLLHVVWAPENRSVVDAYLRGYREALAAGCDWILEIDAGFSHQPSDISKLIAKMQEGYECVFGSRFCPGGRMIDSPFKRRFISRGGTVLTNIALGTRLNDMTSGFELFSRDVLEKVLARGVESRGPFFQTEIKAYCRNLHSIEVPIFYRSPTHDINNASLKDALGNLWRLFRMRLAGRL